MPTCSNGLSPKERRRQASLKAWLHNKGITHTAMAEKLGFSTSYITKTLQGKRASAGLIKRMVSEIGIPRNLLPRPTEGGEVFCRPDQRAKERRSGEDQRKANRRKAEA